MASRNRKGSQMDNLEGKKIIVKYAEGDFHGKIVRKISGSKFIILWEGDSAEDVNPITLDPKKMGKQFKADQNGWEIVGKSSLALALLSSVTYRVFCGN